MPNSAYYRRQADTLLILALTAATDPKLSARYRNLALKYQKLAANAGKNAKLAGIVGNDRSSVAEE
jgi:hypothetical protein